jgi:hypothetical protein
MEVHHPAELVRELELEPGDLIELWSDSNFGVTVYTGTRDNLVPTRVPKGTRVTYVGGDDCYFIKAGQRCWISRESVARVHRISSLTASWRHALTS